MTIVFLLTIGFANQEKGKRAFICLSFLAIGVLIGFRSTEVGSDTANYYNMFSLINYTESENIEIGYLFLVKLFNCFTDDPQSIFIFQGILVALSGAYFIIKNTVKIHEAYISILAFLAFNLFSFHLSGVRQSISMCICLFAYEKIKERKCLSFILIVFIASLFHTSALFFLPAYFIAEIKNKNALLCSAIVTICGILFLEKLMEILSSLNDRFSKYGIENTDNGYIFFVTVMAITLFDLFYRKTILTRTSINELHSKINYFSAGMWIMRLFTRTIERISFFYLPSTIIVLSHTYGAMKTKRDRIIYVLLLSILLITLYLYRMSNWKYSFCF